LPYYSGWTTHDAWGLNTPVFAHRFFRSADVGRLAPDLIVFHPDWEESCVVPPEWRDAGTRSWPHMTRNMLLGAAEGRYELWLTSFGSEFYRRRKHWGYGEGDRECWLVRVDSPMHDAMTQILAEHHWIGPEEASRLEMTHGGVKR
jgi:hypothetical protein